MLRNISTLDLFAGAGGLAQGAKLAGFPVGMAIEKDLHAARTYEANHSSTKIIHRDVRDIGKKDLPQNTGLRILMGGPPCQGFSTSNQKTRNRNNPDIQLIKEYIRIVKLWRPDCVVFENVKGFENAMDGEFFSYLCDHLDSLKYNIFSKVLNSSHYGVPQIRNRLFVIGTKGGSFVMPEKFPKRVTVKEAFSGLPTLHNGANISYLKYRSSRMSGYAMQLRSRGENGCENNLVTTNSPSVIKRYKHIPQGGNWEDIPPSLMGNYKDASRCHTGIYRRLRNSEPSSVIGNFRKNMLVHPTSDRGLSVREAARLQSFHDEYKFMGSIGFQQQQVGNAVPPFLAKAIFTSLRQTLNK